jgi:pimeloyl-ACP methyl ester carboxylesterase
VERRQSERVGLPVVLVQGYGCRPRVLGPLARRIGSVLGRPTLCPMPGLGFGDLRDGALELVNAIEASASHDGYERFDVVAHSMGGLIATYMLKYLDQGRRIRRVVTLGTPFGGLSAAWLASLLGPLGGSLGQIRPHSRLLRRLTGAPVPCGYALVSISGSHDRLVSETAARPGDGPGHYHLDAGPCSHTQLLIGALGFLQIEFALAVPRLEVGGLVGARSLRPAA